MTKQTPQQKLEQAVATHNLLVKENEALRAQIDGGYFRVGRRI